MFMFWNYLVKCSCFKLDFLKIEFQWKTRFLKNWVIWNQIKKKKIHGTWVSCKISHITRFLENRVSKHGYFATSFERKEQMLILPWKTKSVQKVKNHPYPQNLRSSNYCVAHVS